MSVISSVPRLEWKRAVWGLILLLLAVWVGKTTVASQPLVLIVCALLVVVIAMPFVDLLAVALFWALPYMVVNLPTGVFTLKLPELVAYVFAAATFVRVLMRREKFLLPAPTAQVLVYFAAMCLSICFAPPVPIPFMGSVTSIDRNSPNIRPFSVVFWLALSWLVVVCLVNIIDRRPELFRRCLRAHILSSGLASAISVTLYVLTLLGGNFVNLGGANTIRSMVPQSGSALRLAGVAYEPLFLAFYLITTIPLTMVAIVNSPTWLPRRLAIISLAVQCIAMLLTFSAGGWVGLVIALVIIAPLCRLDRLERKVRRSITVGISLFVATIVGVVISQEKALLEIAALVSKLGGSDSTRKGEWMVGMRLFQEYPLLGCGPGLATYAFPRFHYAIQSQTLSGVHEINNLFLSVLGETGAVGLAALGWCALTGIGVLCRTIRRLGMSKTPVLTALTASLFGCAIQYMSMNPLFLIYFAALVGLTLSATRYAELGYTDPLNEKSLV